MLTKLKLAATPAKAAGMKILPMIRIESDV
jgi:hypothetical protein